MNFSLHYNDSQYSENVTNSTFEDDGYEIINVTSAPYQRDEWFAQVEIGILATIFCVAVLSNGKN